jgi:hypothetical protein
MVSLTQFAALALALPNSSEHPHFENVSFKAKNKIFATLKDHLTDLFFKESLVTSSHELTFCLIKYVFRLKL